MSLTAIFPSQKNFQDLSQIVLGTAQLGMPYGIANKKGVPDFRMARDIIQAAWQMGVREIDTAQGYGQSEEIIGSALKDLGIAREAKIITKLDTTIDLSNKNALIEAVNGSLKRLNVPSLHGLMLHREEFLDQFESRLKFNLNELVKKGLTKYVGVSVYSANWAVQAVKTEGIAMVQVPTSFVDRRFIQKGIFDLAEENHKQIYVRSIFLQGLIFLQPDEIPSELKGFKPVIQAMDEFGKRFDLTRLDIACGYVRQRLPLCKFVVGIEDLHQIIEIKSSWMKSLPMDFSDLVDQTIPACSEWLLNPSLWKKLS